MSLASFCSLQRDRIRSRLNEIEQRYHRKVFAARVLAEQGRLWSLVSRDVRVWAVEE